MVTKMISFVDHQNANIASMEGNRDLVFKYTLPTEGMAGKLELVFDKSYYEGIACSLDSIRYKYARVAHVYGLTNVY